MSLENSGSASRFDAQTNGGIHDPDSFAKVVPIAPQAAAMFYDRRLVLDPNRSARAP
jgi:hypothetical protein